jgi:hypothetical protein
MQELDYSGVGKEDPLPHWLVTQNLVSLTARVSELEKRMISEPIPNKNPRCKCVLGKALNDDEGIVLCGTSGVVFTAYRDCPLHGEYVKKLAESAMKGLSA